MNQIFQGKEKSNLRVPLVTDLSQFSDQNALTGKVKIYFYFDRKKEAEHAKGLQ